jgi:NADH:ubiquinone oxidoreductase subunit B-like Fe-S oxidoreductase
MLKDKEEEMIEFINRYMSKKDINRIGEDIIRIMPCRGDIAIIKLNILIDQVS